MICTEPRKGHVCHFVSEIVPNRTFLIDLALCRLLWSVNCSSIGTKKKRYPSLSNKSNIRVATEEFDIGMQQLLPRFCCKKKRRANKSQDMINISRKNTILYIVLTNN